MSVAKKAGKASVLLLLKKGWNALISFFVLAYLARTLNTDDFGLVAISATLISFIQVLSVSGIGEYIIFYNKKNQDEINNSAFWLNLLLTFITSVIILIIAPLWSKFYNDDRIYYIIVLLNVNFFFNLLSVIPISILRKRINYKPIIFTQTVFGTVVSILKVLFAYYGFGVYSLALPSAIVAPFITFTLFKKSEFVPRLNFGTQYWKQIFGYTKFVIGQRLFNKIINEGDNLIIGKIFGLKVLGAYTLAFQFANLVSGMILPLISNISVPVMAKNNNNIKVVLMQYIKMIRLIVFMLVPITTVLILNGELLFYSIYGDKWKASIIIFQILSVGILFKAISSPTSGLIHVMGKPKIGFYFTAIFSILFIFSILISTLFNDLIITTVVITALRVIGSFILISISLNLLAVRINPTLNFLIPLYAISLIFISLKFIIGKIDNIYSILLSFIYICVIIVYYMFFYSHIINTLLNDIKKINPYEKKNI
jgi:O-antigen/teichoic acid export membrane protein